MEKDALLEIIIHEVKEVERLLETFRGNTPLSAPFIKLAHNKAQNVVEEIDLLQQLTAETSHRAAPTTDVSIDKGTDISHETTVHQPIVSDQISPSKTEVKPHPQENISTEKTIKETPSLSPENSPRPQQKTTKVTSPNNGTQKGTLGENLRKNQSSFNDLIAEKSNNRSARRILTAAPVADLQKALGINDRFLFQRELFGGNGDLLNQTLDQLNQMKSAEDARRFLTTNFNWKPDNETAAEFWDLVERRFI